MTHVPDDLFDEDYLYFYEERLGPEQSEREAELIARLAGLEPGAAVLDVPCGHGRISGPLASRGCEVLGIDASELFISRACELYPDVRFELGDMRELGFEAEFDCVVNWFSSFGYFEPEENDRLLASFARALKPGGRLVLDQRNPDATMRLLEVMPEPAHVLERGSDFQVDRLKRDGARLAVDRWTVRDGRVRKTGFSLELIGAEALRERLSAAGFADISLYDGEGGPFDPASTRLIATATR